MRPAAVLLQGIDVGDTSYWSWEWRDDIAPGGVHVIPLDQVTAVLAELDDALPGVRPAEQVPVEQLREMLSQAPSAVRAASRETQDWMIEEGFPEHARTGALRSYVAVNRSLTGAFARPDAESSLMLRLAEVLLHDDFSAQLEDVGDTTVELAVLPSQSCARVPWELLRLCSGDDTRILERAIVTTLAPLLTRGDEVERPSNDTPRSPLRVIDPASGGFVLDASVEPAWTARPGRVSFHEVVDRIWLSEMLPAASHLTYVGHVATDPDDPEPALTGLVLGESPAEVWGASVVRGERRLTAHDALRGTVGYTGTLAVPPAARGAGGEVLQRPGRELWPMPSRVAIIACESGSDYRDVEPFGLVTAFLELGAESVTATRWALLTDHAFGLYEEGASPLNTAALDVDSLQDEEAHPDPVAALAEWKRARLHDWRRDGKLSDSPITWGAFTLYRAGERA